MAKVITTELQHSGASAANITMDSSKNVSVGNNVTITGDLTVTGVNNAKYDDSSLRKDLATLALQTAVDTNRKAYNLNNSFIDQFEDDSGIGTETNVDRNSSEYVSSSVVANVAFKWGDGGAQDSPAIVGINPHCPVSSTGATGGWTSDRCKINNNTGSGNNYGAAYYNFAFDCAHNFDFYSHCAVDGSVPPGIHNDGYQTIGAIIDRSDKMTAGVDPKFNNTAVLRKAEISGNNTYVRNMDKGNIDSWVFTSAYGTEVTSDSFEQNRRSDGNSHNQGYDMDNDGGNGSWYALYYNSGDHTDAYGIKATYNATSKQLVIGFKSNGTGFTSNGPKMTISDVPNTAKIIFLHGKAGDQTTRYISGFNNGGTESSGTVTSTAINATGTVIGTANTASSSRTKVSGTFLYKNAAGTATIGTDLKIYFTCNGGTNWTEAASYTAGSDFSTGIKTIYLGETTCTAGTDVRYKAVWANQSASKETQLHGIGVNY